MQGVMRKLYRLMELFRILIVVKVTQLYTNNKIHQTLSLKISKSDYVSYTLVKSLLKITG